MLYLLLTVLSFSGRAYACRQWLCTKGSTQCGDREGEVRRGGKRCRGRNQKRREGRLNSGIQARRGKATRGKWLGRGGQLGGEFSRQERSSAKA